MWMDEVDSVQDGRLSGGSGVESTRWGLRQRRRSSGVGVCGSWCVELGVLVCRGMVVACFLSSLVAPMLKFRLRLV